MAAAPDAEEGLLVFEIVDDDGDGTVGVEGGSSNALVTRGGARYAPGAGPDEAREVAKDEVWEIEGEFAGGGVSVDNGA